MVLPSTLKGYAIMLGEWIMWVVCRNVCITVGGILLFKIVAGVVGRVTGEAVRYGFLG